MRIPRYKLVLQSGHDSVDTMFRHWPGIEGDTKPFTNVAFDDDLFSLSERRQAASDEFDDDYDEELDAEC